MNSTTKDIVGSMLRGELTDEQILTQLTKWSTQPVTPDHLVAGATAMREAMVSVELEGSPIDTCGTGGSGLKTINTSTLVAFLVTAAGGTVAKHGNRSASGNCGCFDVLEGLGVNIELTPDQEKIVYDALGIVFLYAKSHHPAMRFVGPARKQFGKKTLFNLLGPLCNPAVVTRQMVGTGNADDAALMIAALKQLGTEQALIVSGNDGLDEVTICSTTTVQLLDGESTTFDPLTHGIEYADPHDIEGGSVEENVAIVRSLAMGRGTRLQQNLIVVNAAHALWLAGLVATIEDGIALAREVLLSGRVLELIERYVEASNDVSS